ncbi:MAG: tRNA (adenosine(37)-N6)-threonylcarbamoyltransferase complex dimerization subunit type 1 TsaB, partial [Actinomycetota bacterium]|nr:tRNA (adenosine(37)-N6)-threonylcarbamoyltransferase complex dimerization subunit type 1 TsaB [Actinomycetota bacterium]
MSTPFLLLALDTSTTAITVALHDGTAVLAEVTVLDARGHAEHLAPAVQQALNQASAAAADVTDVAVGLGPGPFTGLRVGIVTARTFALAVGARVHGVGSLDVLAHSAVAGGHVTTGGLLVATDARRKEVYWARYAVTPGEPGSVTARTAAAVTRPADL